MVPMKPPATAVTATVAADTSTPAPRTCPQIRVSTAAGTVTDPISSNEGKKLVFWVETITHNTAK